MAVARSGGGGGAGPAVSGAGHERWMRRALALAAEAAAAGEVPVGAVVVREVQLLGEGYNRPIASHDPTAHAECVALRAAARNLGNYRLPGATLYVTLAPCMMCAGALVHARIHQLVYATTEPRSGAVVSQAQLLASPWLNHRVAVTGGALQEEASQLLLDFFRARRGRAASPSPASSARWGGLPGRRFAICPCWLSRVFPRRFAALSARLFRRLEGIQGGLDRLGQVLVHGVRRGSAVPGQVGPGDPGVVVAAALQLVPRLAA